jgi:pantoate--beta-alanine ligase
MIVIEHTKEMQDTAQRLRHKGKTIALVPTMGFLHEGHLKLVDVAKKHAEMVVMSLFVNPKQFGPSEDFERYPRDLERDKSLAKSRGVDLLFVPAVEEVYPPGDQTSVLVTELTRGLCGAFRPGHFRGVTTVVAKLFLMVQPHVAIFGEKDYQQLIVIRRMVRDLHFPIQILGVETVREPDGLAMSSRNSYLNAEEQAEALNLYQAIRLAQDLIKKGEKDIESILKRVRDQLLQGSHIVIDYAEIVDAEELTPLKTLNKAARLVLAVRVNGKRLIDNGPLIL